MHVAFYIVIFVRVRAFILMRKCARGMLIILLFRCFLFLGDAVNFLAVGPGRRQKRQKRQNFEVIGTFSWA